METYDARIAVLEANYASLTKAWEKTETLIVEKIDNLREAVLERIARLEYAINGNGKPGLADRVSMLERLFSHSDGERSNSDRTWGRLAPFVPYIGAILFGAAMYYIGSKGGKP